MAGRACACKRAVRRRQITGSPHHRLVSRRSEGLPGSWVVLFVRAVVEHPAGYDLSLPLPLFEEIHGKVIVAFRENRTLGIRNVIAFEAAVPRLTRSRAYASPASLPRPAPGSLPARAGSPLAGRVSHPLDDRRSFMKSSQSSIPLRPAEPGRTVITMLSLPVGQLVSNEVHAPFFVRPTRSPTTTACHGADLAIRTSLGGDGLSELSWRTRRSESAALRLHDSKLRSW